MEFDPQRLVQARHLVVFSGAGVSAESAIPTFRDALTGLWENFDPARLATPQAFREDPALVWGWYEWRRMKVLQARPSPAHLAIAELARRVPRLTLITQNVDDLHERAGSPSVLHLHGSLHHPKCFACNRPFSGELPEPLLPEQGCSLEPPPLHRLQRQDPPRGGVVRRSPATAHPQRGIQSGRRMRPAVVGRHLGSGAAGGANPPTGAGTRCLRGAHQPAAPDLYEA